jgi:hypothetical protein
MLPSEARWQCNQQKRGTPMPMRMAFTVTEREKLGALVNNFSIFAAQLVVGAGTDLATRALANLAKIKMEHDDLLRRLDELARESGDESALRLIEDLPRMPGDLAQSLTVIRRCLLASAFLGHCMARPMDEQITRAEPLSEEKRLH